MSQYLPRGRRSGRVSLRFAFVADIVGDALS
jgi:hypothetical protein